MSFLWAGQDYLRTRKLNFKNSTLVPKEELVIAAG
jgi:hypothetical protein